MRRTMTHRAALGVGIFAFFGHTHLEAQSWQDVPTEGRCMTILAGGEKPGVLYGLTDGGIVSRYDGAWTDIGTASYGPVTSMCYTDGRLYLAGHLRDANENALVQFWDGSRWDTSRLPSQGLVRKIIPRAPHGLYACGSLAGCSVYMYDGTHWSPLQTVAAVDAIAADTQAIYAGGTILPGGVLSLLRWNGALWEFLDASALESLSGAGVNELYAWKDGLYSYTRNCNCIMRYDGASWTASSTTLGNDATFYVKSFVGCGNYLYAVVQLGGHDSSFVVRHALGSADWQPVGDLSALHPKNVENVVSACGIVYAQGEQCFLARYGVPQAVPELAAQKEIAIYPNPAHDMLEVRSPQPGAYVISDMLGRVRITGELRQAGETVSTETLPVGTYVFRMGTETVRFSKQ